MNYTIISAVCNDQSLNLKSSPLIASGGINETLLSVEFSSEWDGFIKTAVFSSDDESVYHVLLENDSCVIPKEVLATSGVFYFGIMGCSENTLRTSDTLRYTVRKGASTRKNAVPDPTPDVYTQLVSRIAAIEATGGVVGPNGASAYEIAVDNGFEGTEAQWLSSLNGANGYTPQKGVDYFTDADTAVIVNAVLAALPDGDEVNY